MRRRSRKRERPDVEGLGHGVAGGDEGECDAFAPGSVGDLGEAHGQIAAGRKAIVDGDWVLVVARGGRRGQQEHRPVCARHNASLVRGEVVCARVAASARAVRSVMMAESKWMQADLR